MRDRALWVLLPLVASAGCAKRPPPDFAPDPGLVAQIREIRMFTPASACPGQTVHTSYGALLADGREIPFATRYDDDHPPELHVVFLSRYSPTAVALENGNWRTADEPLLSAREGFRLRASLRANPAMVAEETLMPDYSCANHVFGFVGGPGGRGEPGGPGPDVTVRMGLLSSPFYERLLIVGVRVEDAPPFYVLADADVVPPADWIMIASQGGRGGRGVNGSRGREGADGQAGCPGSPGGAGGAGGNGGPGGPGGRGGRVTVIVPDDQPFVAGLVDARSEGGEGGPGGRGGQGGAGGEGGAATGGRRCAAGADGPEGPPGRPGREGADGLPGPRPQIITLPAEEVFGDRVPPELAALLQYHYGENQGDNR